MSYETFDPAAHGCRLQYGYQDHSVFQVAEEESEIGTVKSTAISERVLQRFEGLTFKIYGRAGRDYIQSFLARHLGPAGRFYWQSPEYLPSPDKAPTLVAISGGSQAERTITACYAWKNSAGTTSASPTASLVVPASELVRVTVDPYPGTATQCVIYAAEDDAGNEQQQTILTNVRSWTQPDDALLLATADPPTVNTAVKTALWRLVGQPTYQRGIGLTWTVTLSLEEVYVQ